MNEKKCLICDKSFSVKGNSKICNSCKEFHCVKCNKKMIRSLKEIKANKRFCSRSCAQSSQATKEKIAKTQTEKYGGVGFAVGNNWNTISDEEKSKRTEASKSGFAKFQQDKIAVNKAKQKREETNLKKYGAKTPLSNKSTLRSAINEKLNEAEVKKKIVENSQKTKALWSPETKTKVNNSISEANKRKWIETESSEKRKRAKKISTSRKRFFENETDEERELRRSKFRSKVQSKWSNMSDEKLFNIVKNRHLTLSKSEHKRITKVNKYWGNLIEERFKVKVIYEKSLNGMNYDLLVDNVLIDINPTVSHNAEWNFAHFVNLCKDKGKFCPKHKLLPVDYHLRRAENANELGYDWFFIFDHYDERKVLDMIGAKLNKNEKVIYGRKTKAQIIDKTEALRFVKKYHLLGGRKKSDVNIGLTINDELLSVMSFSLKNEENSSWELTRYVNKANFAILGGAQKLFKKFISEYKPEEISTYSDFNFGAGNIYKKLGFNLEEKAKPSLFWSNLKTGDFLNDNSLRLGADRVLANWAKRNKKTYFHVGNNFDDFLDRNGFDFYSEYLHLKELNELPSNRQIAQHYNFVKVYDCGYQKFKWKRENDNETK